MRHFKVRRDTIYYGTRECLCFGEAIFRVTEYDSSTVYGVAQKDVAPPGSRRVGGIFLDTVWAFPRADVEPVVAPSPFEVKR